MQMPRSPNPGTHASHGNTNSTNSSIYGGMVDNDTNTSYPSSPTVQFAKASHLTQPAKRSLSPQPCPTQPHVGLQNNPQFTAAHSRALSPLAPLTGLRATGHKINDHHTYTVTQASVSFTNSIYDTDMVQQSDEQQSQIQGTGSWSGPGSSTNHNHSVYVKDTNGNMNLVQQQTPNQIQSNSFSIQSSVNYNNMSIGRVSGFSNSSIGGNLDPNRSPRTSNIQNNNSFSGHQAQGARKTLNPNVSSRPGPRKPSTNQQSLNITASPKNSFSYQNYSNSNSQNSSMTNSSSPNQSQKPSLISPSQNFRTSHLSPTASPRGSYYTSTVCDINVGLNRNSTVMGRTSSIRGSQIQSFDINSVTGQGSSLSVSGGGPNSGMRNSSYWNQTQSLRGSHVVNNSSSTSAPLPPLNLGDIIRLFSDKEKLYAVLSNNKLALRCYMIASLFMGLVFFILSDQTFSFLLTISSMVSFFSFLLILFAIESARSCDGLSVRMMELWVIIQIARLFAIIPFEGYLPYDTSGDWLQVNIIEGYLPYDTSGDWFYQVNECCIMLVIIAIIYSCKFRFHSTYLSEYDDFPNISLAIGCTLVAIIAHPSLNWFIPSDICWALALYLEACSAIPQLFLFQKQKKILPWTCHFLAAQSFSRICTMVFWIASFSELHDTSHADHLLEVHQDHINQVQAHIDSGKHIDDYRSTYSDETLDAAKDAAFYGGHSAHPLTHIVPGHTAIRNVMGYWILIVQGFQLLLMGDFTIQYLKCLQTGLPMNTAVIGL